MSLKVSIGRFFAAESMTAFLSSLVAAAAVVGPFPLGAVGFFLGLGLIISVVFGSITSSEMLLSSHSSSLLSFSSSIFAGPSEC